MPEHEGTSSTNSLVILSRLLFPPLRSDGQEPAGRDSGIATVNKDQFDELRELAGSNHVIVRTFDAALKILRNAGDETRAGWVDAALAAEHSRIANAIEFLHAICAAFDEQGFDATVIKSLDHWPDIGSDLDLYTNTAPERVIQLMVRRFRAQLAPRSWGDRLACKWNFVIPGLPEAVEIHMGRLGQTGEQMALAWNIARRSRTIQIGGRSFRVAGVSDRMMISTLQRMYRHFYFRICDIADTAELVDAGKIDYEDLRATAAASGIWEGVTTYMKIVSDYVKQYRGGGFDLPWFVANAARFGGSEVYFARGFLRVPILPQSAGLYGTQLTGLLRKGDFESSARLSLLPWLATAAAVGQKLTGSDKGIW